MAGKTKKKTTANSNRGSKKKTIKTIKKTEELDVVSQAQAELEQLEQDHLKNKANGNFSWVSFAGGCLLGIALALIAGKTFPGIIAGDSIGALEKKLPEILKPLSGGMQIKQIGKPTRVGNLYQFTLEFDGIEQTFTSYITGDSKTFFVEGIEVEELLKSVEGETNGATASGEVSAASCDAVDKSSKPELAAYIVSDCPYGKQAQQVMLDAIKQEPSIAQNFKVRYFFNTIEDDGTVTAMHGPEEGKENLRQICIREEQANKYWDYVACYAKSSGGPSASETCLSQTGVNVANVNSCMTTASRGPKFARADNQAAQAASVTGSPTFIINNKTKVTESSFGGRNANGLKNIVCCSSDNALSFCDKTFTTDAAAANGNC